MLVIVFYIAAVPGFFCYVFKVLSKYFIIGFYHRRATNHPPTELENYLMWCVLLKVYFVCINQISLHFKLTLTKEPIC